MELILETEDLAADAPVALDLLLKISSRTIGDHQPDRPLKEAEVEHFVQKPDESFNQHINTYVAKLGADSCRKILLAAAYNLTLADGRESFSKDELFSRAREAREWKADYTNQQASNIGRMVKFSQLIEKSGGNYCVPGKELEVARQTLSA